MQEGPMVMFSFFNGRHIGVCFITLLPSILCMHVQQSSNVVDAIFCNILYFVLTFIMGGKEYSIPISQVKKDHGGSRP